MLAYVKKGCLGIVIVAILATITSCSTFYQKNAEFNQTFEEGKLEQADKVLSDYKKIEKKGYRFAYYLDRGVVKHLLGDYTLSNDFFEKAYIFGEDYKKKLGDEIVSTLLNPNLSIYYGEDHEHLLPLYYKALNYIQLGDLQSALVECRRLNIRLGELSDRYKSANKYRRDAFIHMLMAMLYEAEGDDNNAFIAYRNAYEIYKEDYNTLFGIGTPKQLKLDLLNSAARNGFEEDRLRYEQEMNLRTPSLLPDDSGELVFFWNNGLGPVKDQIGITLALVKGVGGAIVFENAAKGIAIPFAVSSSNRSSLNDLRSIRITYPIYKDRTPYFDRAELRYSDTLSSSLQLAEPVTAIARKCLSERMLWEFSRSLIRVALREVAEAAIRKKNPNLGLITDIAGTLTESSDTRCWQTLPSAIHYVRIRLAAGEQTLVLQLSNEKGSHTQDTLRFNIRPGRLHFHSISSIESTYPSY